MPIIRPPLRSATALLLCLGGCGRAAAPAGAPPKPDAPLRVLALDQLYVLEMSGIPPEDTVVTFRAGSPRTIILRHGAPDNTTFVELRFPEDAFAGTGAPESVTVSVHPRPGVYGVTIATSVSPFRGATIRFRYPVHFSAPIAALQKYGGTAQYERALGVARQLGGANFGLLPSDRPASDNLQSALPDGGVYLVAAPR